MKILKLPPFGQWVYDKSLKFLIKEIDSLLSGESTLKSRRRKMIFILSPPGTPRGGSTWRTEDVSNQGLVIRALCL